MTQGSSLGEVSQQHHLANKLRTLAVQVLSAGAPRRQSMDTLGRKERGPPVPRTDTDEWLLRLRKNPSQIKFHNFSLTLGLGFGSVSHTSRSSHPDKGAGIYVPPASVTCKAALPPGEVIHFQLSSKTLLPGALGQAPLKNTQVLFIGNKSSLKPGGAGKQYRAIQVKLGQHKHWQQ